MWTVSTGKGHWHVYFVLQYVHPYINNIYSARVPMHSSLLTDTRPRLAIAYGCGTRIYPRTGAILLAMCQRPLWSKCQRLTHHADILVRPTACRRFYNTNLLESFLTLAVCFQSVTESLTRSTEGFSAPLASLLHAISVSNNLSDFCC